MLSMNLLWLPEHTSDPPIVHTRGELTEVLHHAILDAVTHGRIVVRATFPRHFRHNTLYIGLDGSQGGALFYRGIQHPGGCFSRGHQPVAATSYSHMGEPTVFPADTTVSVTALHTAVEEFHHTGGARPQTVSWHPDLPPCPELEPH